MKTEETTKEEYRPQNVIENKNKCCARLKNSIKHVTVEPVSFLVMFSSFLQLVAMQVMGLEKACRMNLAIGDEICDALRGQKREMDFSTYEKIAQEFYSRQLVWKSVLQTILPSIMMIFVGGWSDTTGRRKAIMLFCVGGEIAQSLNNVINVIFLKDIGLEMHFFVDVLIIGVVGGPSVMFMALTNYICDITTKENRTQRMGFVCLCTFAGIPLGVPLSGIVLSRGGYYAIFGLSLSLHAINFLYILFLIFDTARTREQRKYDDQGVVQFLKVFFNPGTIKEIFAMVWKKTENNRRKQLIILLVTITFIYGTFHGEHATLFLSARYRFNWNEVEYSLYQTYSFFVGCVAPFADILSGSMVAMTAVRTMYSKLVNPCELGKMTSLVALVENLMPFIYVPMYTNTYTATMDTLPGAVYLLGAALSIPELIAFTYLYRMHRVALRRTKNDLSTHLPDT